MSDGIFHGFSHPTKVVKLINYLADFPKYFEVCFDKEKLNTYIVKVQHLNIFNIFIKSSSSFLFTNIKDEYSLKLQLYTK